MTGLDIRNTDAPQDIEAALLVDASVIGSRERAEYIGTVARQGGLSVVDRDRAIVGFSCIDHNYFLGKPFVTLLIISPHAHRQGLGRHLLSHSVAMGFHELWTSTNRSNLAMVGLLRQASWQYCGTLDGLDKGDPELFFKKTG